MSGRFNIHRQERKMTFSAPVLIYAAVFISQPLKYHFKIGGTNTIMIKMRISCKALTIAGSAPTIEAVNTISINPPGATLSNAVGRSILVNKYNNAPRAKEITIKAIVKQK